MGRTFQESFQKALRGLETGIDGLTERSTDREEIVAGDRRGRARSASSTSADAFRIGMTPARRSSRRRRSTRGSWRRSSRSCRPSRRSPAARSPSLSADELRFLKRKGFSDRRLAKLLGTNQHEVRAARHALGVRPVYKRVDTCAAEFATQTAYMYSTYDEECEAEPTDRKKIMVLGGGPNRIGQGIEFDYCCVHAALAMREDGYETIMVNCNPETVSTDYDTSRPPLLRAGDARRRARDRRQGEAGRRDRAVRRPDAAEARARPRARRRADHRHHARQHRHRRGPRALPEAAARARPEAAAQPHRAHRGGGAARWRRRSATRWWCARATCSAAARWRSCTATRTSSATCARRCSVSEKSPVLLDRFLDDAIEVDVDCISDGERRDDRRHHGARRAGRHPLRRLGLLAAAVLAAAGAAGRAAPPDHADGPGAEGRRPDERAVRDPGRGRRAPSSTCSK